MALSLFVEVHAAVTHAQRATARRWAGELRAELPREIPAAVLAQAAAVSTSRPYRDPQLGGHRAV